MTDKQYEELLSRNMGMLRRYAHSLTFNHDDAEQLLSETLLLLWRMRKRYQDEDKFIRYSWRVMKNMNKNILRGMRANKSKLKQYHDSRLIPIEAAKSKCRDEILPNIYYKDLLNLIESSRDLGAHEFRLWLYGYKAKEIAVINNMEVATVKSRIWRFKDMMQKILQ